MSATARSCSTRCPADPLYDVVIHGGNMETIVVHDVFVDPTGLLKPFPTALSWRRRRWCPSQTGETAVSVANALAPRSARVLFGQTLAGSGANGGADVPYTIVAANADMSPADASCTRSRCPPARSTPRCSTCRPAAPARRPRSRASRPRKAPARSACGARHAGRLDQRVRRQGGRGRQRHRAQPGAARRLRRRHAHGGISGGGSNAPDKAEIVVTNGGGTVAVVDVSAQIAAAARPP